MLELLARRWWVLLLRGIAAIGFGILAVLWPGLTLLTLIFVFGAFTVGDGVMAVGLGAMTRHNGRIWWEMVALGILAIIAGAIAALLPGATALFIVYVIAISAIVRGVMEIAAAIQLRKVIDDEWILAISGVLSLLFGGILIAHPGEGALAMVLFIGAWMIAIGAMEIALALRLKQLSRRAGGTTAAANTSG